MLGVTVQNLVAFLHMPRSYNTNFGRGVELWNNTVVKQGKYVLYVCGRIDVEMRIYIHFWPTT